MARKVKRRRKQVNRMRLGILLDSVKKPLYRRLICHLRSYFLSRGIYAPPIIEEICHYPQCPNCGEAIEAQGWSVHFKVRKKKVYEVTFRAMKTRQSKGSKQEEEEDEDEELEVRRPKRLTVGRKRPKALKGEFYVV